MPYILSFFCKYKNKYYISLTPILCVLYLCFFSLTSFAIIDNEYIDLETQLQEKAISPDIFLQSVLILNPLDYDLVTEISTINEKAIRKRNALVRLGLDSGANANKFLEIVVNKMLFRNNLPLFLSLHKQEDLIKIALEKGAKFSDISVDFSTYYNELPSLDAATFMLDNRFDPDRFLSLMLSADNKANNNGDPNFITNQGDLIVLAIAKGAKASETNTVQEKYFDHLISVAAAQSMLKPGSLFNPNKFLQSILLVRFDNNDPTQIKLQYDLIRLALNSGADAKDFLKMVISKKIPTPSGYYLLDLQDQAQDVFIKIAQKKIANTKQDL